jgi:hypothetical protein
MLPSPAWNRNALRADIADTEPGKRIRVRFGKSRSERQLIPEVLSQDRAKLSPFPKLLPGCDQLLNRLRAGEMPMSDPAY